MLRCCRNWPTGYAIATTIKRTAPVSRAVRFQKKFLQAMTRKCTAPFNYGDQPPFGMAK